jgi:hypothetical protein
VGGKTEGYSMSEIERYRRYAEECLNLAEEEEDGGPRLAVLLEMAVTWMKLAQKVNVDTLEKAKYQSWRRN